METLEHHYRDMCDIEFTIEDGKLWMLQTRVGKRTPEAAFRVAHAMVDEGLIDLDEALRRVTGAQLARLMFPRFDDQGEHERLTTGISASPGSRGGPGRARRRDRRALEGPRRGRHPRPRGDEPGRPARAWPRPGAP